MANIIKVGNTVNGYTTTPDQSGALEIRTGPLAGGTTAISIDASQNVAMAANATVAGNLTVTGNIAGAAGLGVGQTWQTFTVSGTGPQRVAGTAYTNSTGKPIMISVSTSNSSINGETLSITVSGVVVAQTYLNTGTAHNAGMTLSTVVPASATYTVNTTSATLSIWAELR
jgi:hypothetical protein